jgi:hypothetical protein
MLAARMESTIARTLDQRFQLLSDELKKDLHQEAVLKHDSEL